MDNKDKLKHWEEACGGWKPERIQRNCPSRDQVRKAKSQTELNLARDIKGNQKSFCKCITNKRKTRENVNPLWKETGDLVTQDGCYHVPYKNWEHCV